MIDLDKPITIELTEADAAASKPENCRHCIVATGIKRTLKTYRVSVDYISLSVDMPDGSIAVWRPDETLQRTIAAFDDGTLKLPATITLRPEDRI